MRTNRGLLGLLALLCVATIVGCSFHENGSRLQHGTIEPPTPRPAETVNVVSLDQGWDNQTREQFWFTTQGSQLLPYAYFLALEQALSTEPFGSPANLDRYRYLPSPPSSLNPDGLPIGFAKHSDPDSGKAFLGFTCAACHTTRIDYDGTGLLIDGAGTLADFQSMFDDLIAALNARPSTPTSSRASPRRCWDTITARCRRTTCATILWQRRWDSPSATR